MKNAENAKSLVQRARNEKDEAFELFTQLAENGERWNPEFHAALLLKMEKVGQNLRIIASALVREIEEV
jgi:hypothetical protein